MSAIEDILSGYEALQPGQEAFYKDLHRHPELSHGEQRTAKNVAERLRGDGFTIASGIGGTGVVGVLANGPADRHRGAGRGRPGLARAVTPTSAIGA